MPLNPSWHDIAIRLILTVICCAIIGFNRGERGHSAGFRTTILVGLAACVVMIQSSLLLSTDGKTPSSFTSMDVLRLPLGVLTGVGFIGGGTILRRGDIVTGVTTAATLWLVTAIGLAFGGGQIILGAAATALGVLTLWGLLWIDVRIRRHHRAGIAIVQKAGEAAIPDLNEVLAPLGYEALFRRRTLNSERNEVLLWYEIGWNRPDKDGTPTDLLPALDARYTVQSFQIISASQH